MPFQAAYSGEPERTMKYYCIIITYIHTRLQTHKKVPRNQQHPSSAFTAAIQKATWARQTQTGKTSQIDIYLDLYTYLSPSLLSFSEV
jgi:hypothetical protein